MSLPDFTNADFRKSLLDAIPQELLEADVLLASGSLVEGYGNGSSDIDLVMINATSFHSPSSQRSANRDTFYLTSGISVHVGYLGSWRLDMEQVDRKVVDDLAEGLRSGSLEENLGFDVSPGLPTTINNIRIGLPLRGGVEYQALRGSFPWDAWCRFLSKRAEYQYRSLSEDAAGAINAKDAGTAWITSQSALGFAIDATTFALGSTNPKPKWRYRKLRDLNQTEVHDLYWELSLDSESSQTAILQKAKRRLQAAQELIMRAGDAITSRST